MNRVDFQGIAELRLRESKALLAAGFPEGAYYLAGYAVECALKACIAKRTQEHDFPERESKDYYKHDLKELLNFAKLKDDLALSVQTNPAGCPILALFSSARVGNRRPKPVGVS